ncbi:MAG: hypothetical protein RI958_72 [Actinomycetota bacterium]
MNDEIEPPVPDDRLLAVSAVLDGSADAAEMALVDSSDETRDLLAEFRSHQESLRSVMVPADAAPWSIGAALDVFDRERGHAHLAPDAAAVAAGVTGTSVAPAGNVVRLRRSTSMARVLTGVAAALVVVMVGMVVVGGIGGSDSELSSSTEPPVAALTQRGAADDVANDQEMPAEAAASALADTTATKSPDSIAADSTAPAATGAPAATEAPPAVNSFSIEAGGATAGTTLSTPDELVSFAAARSALIPLDGQTFRCVEGDDDALGAVQYDGIEAIVTRNRVSSAVSVFDLRDCRILATVTP